MHYQSDLFRWKKEVSIGYSHILTSIFDFFSSIVINEEAF